MASLLHFPFAKVIFSVLLLFSLRIQAGSEVREAETGVNSGKTEKSVMPVDEGKLMEEVPNRKEAEIKSNPETSIYSSPMEEVTIDPKVAEIVKNPVNLDLNKLPSDLIYKIAEGGVTTNSKMVEDEGERKDPEEKKDSNSSMATERNAAETTAEAAINPSKEKKK